MAADDALRAEHAAADLLALYRQAQRTIAAQVEAALRRGDLQTAGRRRLQLSAVLAELDQLGAAVDPAARRLVDDAYQEGSTRTLHQIGQLQIGGPEASTFAGVAHDAVVTLQDSLLGRLDNSMRTVGRSVDDVYARAGRRATMQALLGAHGSPASARRAMVHDLLADRDVRRAVRDGGFGFVDKAGKRWTLSSYADMATRTIIREAAVQGAVQRMAAHGIDLARVSSHANPCKICAPYQGRLVSLDGRRGSYEGEAVYTLGDLPNGGPPMHPRCKHSLAPVSVRVDATRRRMAGAI